MLKKQYDYAVYIGRFQPIHKGHIEAIQQAFQIAENLIIVCGSALRPRDPKNPWHISERFDMIQDAITKEFPEDTQRYKLTYCLDYMYNDTRWLEEVQQRVKSIWH